MHSARGLAKGGYGEDRLLGRVDGGRGATCDLIATADRLSDPRPPRQCPISLPKSERVDAERERTHRGLRAFVTDPGGDQRDKPNGLGGNGNGRGRGRGPV